MVPFIHITDLHLSHSDLKDPNLHSDTESTLREIIKAISSIKAMPKFVVLSGDLTNTGNLKSYELLKQLLKMIPVPIILAIGNHDNRENFYKVFKNKTSSDPYFHDDVYSGLHVITLDSSIPGRIAGEICDNQFKYLEVTLTKFGSIPKLLVLHHPPKMDPDGLPWGSLSMESTIKLENTLKGKNIVGILAGHIHINRVSQWNGIPVCISNGLHSSVDILETENLRIMEGSSFSICVLRDCGLSVSYVPITPKQKELGIIDQKRLRKFS